MYAGPRRGGRSRVGLGCGAATEVGDPGARFLSPGIVGNQLGGARPPPPTPPLFASRRRPSTSGTLALRASRAPASGVVAHWARPTDFERDPLVSPLPRHLPGPRDGPPAARPASSPRAGAPRPAAVPPPPRPSRTRAPGRGLVTPPRSPLLSSPLLLRRCALSGYVSGVTAVPASAGSAGGVGDGPAPSRVSGPPAPTRRARARVPPPPALPPPASTLPPPLPRAPVLVPRLWRTPCRPRFAVGPGSPGPLPVLRRAHAVSSLPEHTGITGFRTSKNAISGQASSRGQQSTLQQAESAPHGMPPQPSM